MHGLRCAPTLLGWTRLLDEWVVGLTRFNRSSPNDPTCWEDDVRTLETLADAATRVRSFAYRDDGPERVHPDGKGMLRFELQGHLYRVAALRCSPGSAGDLVELPTLLVNALNHARSAARSAETAVGVLFVTPCIPSGRTEEARVEFTDQLVAKSRAFPTTGCAYSFPSAAESIRYRYGNERYPGALLLVLQG